MTDTTTSADPTVEETFVRLWGDMGALWGINRTMAEIQGLLYITGRRMNAEDLVDRLGISRGSASMALRALVDWGIVRKVRVRGERRDYFESLDDVWEIFTRVALRRKRREIDPILATLRESRRRVEAASDASADPVPRQRLDAMLAFLGIMEDLSQRFIGSAQGLSQAVQLLAKQV